MPEPKASPDLKSSRVEEITIKPEGLTSDKLVEFDLTARELEVAKILIRVFDLTTKGMTDKQMKKFLSWTNDPVALLRLTARNMDIYARQREGQHNAKDWWLTCDLDLFLKAWPKIWKIVWADDVVTRAMTDEVFRLDCLAYARPEEFLRCHVHRAAEHLAETRFVRRGPGLENWLISPIEISDMEVCAAVYLEHLRNPEIAPFMASIDPNGAVTAARAGLDVSGGPTLRAKAAMDSHNIVLLVESSRRKEHWDELDNDEVRQQARRLLNESAPLRRVFEHFGVFTNYRDLWLTMGEDFARKLATDAELTFYGRVASLTNALGSSSLDCLDEVRAMLKPFGYAV